MDFKTRMQYMDTIRERYLKSAKKEKGRILDKYCRNTGQERKYSINLCYDILVIKDNE